MCNSENMTRKAEGVGHELFMDNFLSSPNLLDELHTRSVNCCGTVRKNHKGMSWSFDTKTWTMSTMGREYVVAINYSENMKVDKRITFPPLGPNSYIIPSSSVIQINY
jgi:hypothetical protein